MVGVKALLFKALSSRLKPFRMRQACCAFNSEACYLELSSRFFLVGDHSFCRNVSLIVPRLVLCCQTTQPLYIPLLAPISEPVSDDS